MDPKAPYPHSWEEAIGILRADPLHQDLIRNAYLTDDLNGNCSRFEQSGEFAEVLNIIRRDCPGARDVLDVPGGNGIATWAFAKHGFNVTAVEPDGSDSVGRGAIGKVLSDAGLTARIIDAFGENLPFDDGSFDVVYVRQGLHHAQDLKAMVKEFGRVLRKGGLLLACREHVVDNYGDSLQKFLAAQADHQLYGGENAFTLEDYRAAIAGSGIHMVEEIPPYDSPINLHPNTAESLQAKIEDSGSGRLLRQFLPRSVLLRLGMWRLRGAKLPGRLYSFVAKRT